MVLQFIFILKKSDDSFSRYSIIISGSKWVKITQFNCVKMIHELS